MKHTDFQCLNMNCLQKLQIIHIELSIQKSTLFKN